MTLLLGAALAVIVVVLLWRQRTGSRRVAQERRLRSRREAAEDALKCLHTLEYEGEAATPERLSERLGSEVEAARSILEELRTRGLATFEATWRLTGRGRDYAIQVVRAHRLWETYLADRTGLDESQWHARAHLREHEMSRLEIDELAAKIGNPTHDPHGDPIPSSDGELPPRAGFPLPELDPGVPGRITHIEDEPDDLYRQIRETGLYPGMELDGLEKQGSLICFTCGDTRYRLESTAAESVTVVPMETPPKAFDCRLSDLKKGQSAVVVSISKACRTSLRRRLMDLGILPGTTIRAELRGPAGDPVAYRVRGTLIGLRAEQAQHIHVNQTEELSQ